MRFGEQFFEVFKAQLFGNVVGNYDTDEVAVFVVLATESVEEYPKNGITARLPPKLPK